MAPLPEGRNLFSYRSFRPNEWLKPTLSPWIFAFTALPPRPKRHNIVNEPQSPYSLSPVSSKSQKLLRWSSLTTTIMCFVATYNWSQEPEKGFAQDLQNSFQSPGRSWAAGRLLPQSGKCTHCQICEELLRLSNNLLARKRLTGAVKMCWALDSEPVYTFGQPAQARYHICGTNAVSHLKNIGSISLVLGHPALWSHQRQWHSYVSLMGRAGQLCGSRHSQGLCPGDCWKLFHGAPFRMSGANIRLNIHILPQSLMSRSGTLQLQNASMFCQVTAPGDRSYCPSSFVLSNLEVWSSPLFSLGLEHWPGMVICWAAAVGTALFCREMSELQGLK